MKNKDIEKLLKGSEKSYLISTKNGSGVSGNIADVLTQFIMLVNNLRKNIPDKLLKSVFEDCFKSEDTLLDELLDKLKKLKEKRR